MSYISIDPKTYRRLEQFAERAGISIHAAASEAVENWMDISTDPRLAITALTTIALTSPDLPEPDPMHPVFTLPAALPPNVTFINANLGASPHPHPQTQNDRSHKLGEAAADTIEQAAR